MNFTDSGMINLRKDFISSSNFYEKYSHNVPRQIIVLTYRSHTANFFRNISFYLHLNVLCFTARFFLFILTIPALIRIVFHVTKKEKEQPLPQFVLSLISCVCRKQCHEQDLCPNDSSSLLIAVTSTLL